MPRRPLLATLATLPFAAHWAFHVWEQWAAFEGREAWLARMGSTSRGALPLLLEIVIAGSFLGFAVFTLRDLVRRQPLPWSARKDDVGFVRAIGVVAPYASVVTIVFVGVHLLELWLPRVAGGGLALQYAELRRSSGTLPHLVLYALGIPAAAWHLAAAIPAALDAHGLLKSPDDRRSAFYATSAFGAALLVLSAQLFGWHATGAGTLWPIDVVEAPMEEPAPIEPAP